MLTANSWNVCQYAALLAMVAKASGLKAGELVHVIADAHIYDRHVPIIEKLMDREGYAAAKALHQRGYYRFLRIQYGKRLAGELSELRRRGENPGGGVACRQFYQRIKTGVSEKMGACWFGSAKI